MNKFNLRDHDWVGYGVLFLAVFVVMSGPSNADQNPPTIQAPLNPPNLINPIPNTPNQPEQIPSPTPQEKPNEGGTLPSPIPSPSPNQTLPTQPTPQPSPGQGKKMTEQNLYNLFANLQSPGVNAIAAAEGNRYPDGRETPMAANGHVDPGNGVFNRGWCSDQGRGKDKDEADRLCLERTRSRMARLTQKFKEVGVDPTLYPEAWVNALDLWNQARPSVSDQFPAKFSQALREQKIGTSAILNARVEAFRGSSGEIEAAGLLRICQRSPSRQNLSAWLCVASDQGRRIRMISAALRHAKVIP